MQRQTLNLWRCVLQYILFRSQLSGQDTNSECDACDIISVYEAYMKAFVLCGHLSKDVLFDIYVWGMAGPWLAFIQDALVIIVNWHVRTAVQCLQIGSSLVRSLVTAAAGYDDSSYFVDMDI